MEFVIFLLIAFIVFVVVFIAKNFKGTPDAHQTASNQTHDELIQNADYLMSLMEVKRQAEERGDSDTVNAVLNMTYDGPLPKKLADGSYSRIYTLYDYNIAGINYREGIADYIGEFEGYLQPDRENEHDPNAIAIYASDGHHLGYIPAYETDEVRSLPLHFPIPVSVSIEECYDYDESRRFFVGSVTILVKRKNTKI